MHFAHVVTLLAILGMAGCTASQGPTVGTRPDDWHSGVQLVSYQYSFNHQGQYTVLIRDNETSRVHQPVRCEAYREAVKYRNDWCKVMGPAISWHLQAAWSGVANGSSLGEPGFNVAIFDQEGFAYGWWQATMPKPRGTTS